MDQCTKIFIKIRPVHPCMYPKMEVPPPPPPRFTKQTFDDRKFLYHIQESIFPCEAVTVSMSRVQTSSWDAD